MARTMFVSTVIGSVIPAYSGREAGSAVGPSAAMIEESNVVAIPLALKSLVRIVLPLEAEELGELRVAPEHLLARPERVVGEEPAAAAARRHVDQPPEGRAGVGQPVGRVTRVQVEDRARIRLLRPREEAFVVTFDEANRSVNAVDVVCAKVVCGFDQKVVERLTRHVQLADDLRRRMLRL